MTRVVQLRKLFTSTQHVVGARSTFGVLFHCDARLSENVGQTGALSIAPAGDEASRSQSRKVLTLRWQADRADVAVELNGLLQLHHGDVKVPLGESAQVVGVLLEE